MLVADSLQREELGEIGTVSNVALGVENDDPVGPDLEEETSGRDEEIESDTATGTRMGRAVVLMWGTPPSCKEQVKACKALPAATPV